MYRDTIALLGDCTAGIERTVRSIYELLPDIRDRELRKKLQLGMEDHRKLHHQAVNMLAQYGAAEKHPGTMENSLRKFRLGARMAMGGDDTTAATLVADGCDRRIRELSKSQNQHCMASAQALDLSQQLIHCGERLSSVLRPFL